MYKRQILKRLFAGEGVKYEITENNFILINPSTKNEKTAPSSQAVLQKKNLVHGVVTDENGEPIIGANVVEKGTTNGTVTDLDGKFTIEVSENGVLHHEKRYKYSFYAGRKKEDL